MSLSKQKPAPLALKPCCDQLATFHRDRESGVLVTRLGGVKSGTAIYVTADPEVIRVFDEILKGVQ